MTYAGTNPEARAVAGIGDGLLRLSAGLETAEDLTTTVIEALDKTQGRRKSAG